MMYRRLGVSNTSPNAELFNSAELDKTHIKILCIKEAQVILTGAPPLQKAKQFDQSEKGYLCPQSDPSVAIQHMCRLICNKLKETHNLQILQKYMNGEPGL